MQPPFQQSAASAHIDDLMRAAQSYRLTAVDGQRATATATRSRGASGPSGPRWTRARGLTNRSTRDQLRLPDPVPDRAAPDRQVDLVPPGYGVNLTVITSPSATT